MSVLVAEPETEALKHRLTVYTTEEVDAALRIVAARRNVLKPKLAHDILAEYLADEIEQIRAERTKHMPDRKRKS